MDPGDVLIIALAVLGGALPMGAIAAWHYHYRRVRELERRLLDGTDESSSRVAELERIMSALVEQVDQLAQGQEFLARLTTENQRQPLPPVDRSPRAHTPVRP